MLLESSEMGAIELDLDSLSAAISVLSTFQDKNKNVIGECIRETMERGVIFSIFLVGRLRL